LEVIVADTCHHILVVEAAGINGDGDELSVHLLQEIAFPGQCSGLQQHASLPPPA
jgi:hypothetical protein